MPELPELEVIRDYLAPRLVGVAIRSAEVRRPIVVRNLLGGDLADHLVGRSLVGVERRGKLLLLELATGVWLVFHPMLSGRLRHGEPLGRDRVRDVLVLGLADGHELRYHDAKDMGKVYLTDDLGQIPGLADLGPEANDPALTLDAFRQRIRPFRGEIKGVLVNQAFLAGIGNAYADEICWRACLYPFRKRTSLKDEEVARLYAAMRAVLTESVETLRGQLGESIDREARDFTAVHGRAGQPCPRCGSLISEVKRERRATHFCRACQPGLLVGGR